MVFVFAVEDYRKLGEMIFVFAKMMMILVIGYTTNKRMRTMNDPIRELIATVHEYTIVKSMDPPVVSQRCMIFDVKEPEELRQKIVKLIGGNLV